MDWDDEETELSTADVPKTDRVTNSVFIVFAELALLQWTQTPIPWWDILG
jgi:hypothetical protein